jgi:hypothetical protein
MTGGVLMGVMFMLAPVMFAAIVGVPVLVLLWVARRRDGTKAQRRGFEMKPISGESPEQTERETNHG